MAMGSGGDIRAAVAEINVTPLIDALLVLLIIFMVIVPVTPKGLDSALPLPAKTSDQPPPNRTVVVEVLDGKGGPPSYRINDTVFAKVDLEPELVEIFASRQEKTMFVKGDPDLIYANVAEVVDFGHQAGVQNIGILTPKSASGQ